MRLSEGGAGDGGHSDGKDEAGWERPVRRRQTAMVVGDRAGPVRAWRAKGVDRWWGLDAGRAAREAAAEPDLERRICVRHPVAARWSRRVCRLLASRPGRSSRPIVIRSVRFRAGQGVERLHGRWFGCVCSGVGRGRGCRSRGSCIIGGCGCGWCRETASRSPGRRIGANGLRASSAGGRARAARGLGRDHAGGVPGGSTGLGCR